jgi:hypothetical protein
MLHNPQSLHLPPRTMPMRHKVQTISASIKSINQKITP